MAQAYIARGEHASVRIRIVDEAGGRLTISAQTTMLDLPACLTLCCVAVLPPLLKGKFYRWQGLLMLVIYAAYMVMLALA